MDTPTQGKRKRKIKSTQLFVVAGTILVSLLISLVCVGLTVRYEVDTETADVKSIEYWKMNLPPEQGEWFEKGIAELKSMIIKKEQRDEVENVVIFIVEGVNADYLSKARFKQKAHDHTDMPHEFIWDTFPHLGLLKSSCSSEENCDAFTLATALFGGLKTAKGVGGLDLRVDKQNCEKALNETFHIDSIFKQAKALKLRTGFVTTRSVAGPLMAGLYAHSSDTKWLCDGVMPEANIKAGCLDVAWQLLKSQEGRNINVIMGGGRKTLVSKVPISNHTVVDDTSCVSLDKRNLLQDWQSYRLKEKSSYKLLQTTRALERLNGSACDYILGIFSYGDLTHVDPNLTDMVTKSLDVLQRKDTGYVFVAETAIKKSNKEQPENFQQILWDLDETIRTTFKYPRYTSSNTVLLTVFLDLNHNASIANDILLYATGPKSYLFHGVHEETYMAHVISYYLKMGIFKPSKNK